MFVGNKVKLVSTHSGKGNSENSNDFRALIPTITEKVSTLLGRIESNEEEFNEAYYCLMENGARPNQQALGEST
jgi:hypothetical protein